MRSFQVGTFTPERGCSSSIGVSNNEVFLCGGPRSKDNGIWGYIRYTRDQVAVGPVLLKPNILYSLLLLHKGYT